MASVKTTNRFEKLIARIEKSRSVSAIRNGLIMIVPLLLIGSFSLAVQYFPNAAYQQFLTALFNGNAIGVLRLIYNATFGMISVALVATIAYSYASGVTGGLNCLCSTVVSLGSFFVLTGMHTTEGLLDVFGVKGMFLAICSSVVTAKLYFVLYRRFSNRKRRYTDGSDPTFNASIEMFLSGGLVLLFLTIFEVAVEKIFGVNNLYILFSRGANALFLPMGRSFVSGLLFVVFSSVLWFFGIHGSDALEPVMEKLFTPALNENMAQAAAGNMPTQIFTKQFFDVFVLMGGCGTAICLLLSIILFSRRKSTRRLSRMAAFPMIFNISEIMVFGFPVAFNPTLFIPFVLTPICAFITSFLAMTAGIVPPVISEVNWTTPVLLGGYYATGSFAGSALQLFNIVLGVFIYRPFILAYDRKREADTVAHYRSLVETVKQSESTLIPVQLTDLQDERGILARSLTEELRVLLRAEQMPLYYQPQFDDQMHCFGAEALLRFNHPGYGMVYPPLVIQLAREDRMLDLFEKKVFLTAFAAAEQMSCEIGYNGEIGVNVSASTILSESYMDCLREKQNDNPDVAHRICLEITEQTALIQDHVVLSRLREINKMGYKLAIDDFSMGHTSLSYLQNNQFDIVKIDGSLVRQLGTNPVCKNIILSIIELSKSLGFTVLAECVETKQQEKLLGEIGCTRYQGWLFGKAMAKEELMEKLSVEKQSAVANK